MICACGCVIQVIQSVQVGVKLRYDDKKQLLYTLKIIHILRLLFEALMLSLCLHSHVNIHDSLKFLKCEKRTKRKKTQRQTVYTGGKWMNHYVKPLTMITIIIIIDSDQLPLETKKKTRNELIFTIVES